MSVVFEVNNCDSTMATVAPVVGRLRAMGIAPVNAIYTGRCFGLAESPGVLSESFDDVHVVSMDDWLHLPFISRPRRLRQHARAMRERLRHWGPGLLVAANDATPVEHVVVAEAQRLGIGTLLLQESIRKDHRFRGLERRVVAATLRRALGYRRGLRGHGGSGVDAVAAWGEQGRAYFVRQGVAAESIRITGSPRVEALVGHCRALDRVEQRRELGVPDDAETTLFCTNPIDGMGMVSARRYGDLVSRVVRVVAGQDNGPRPVHLILKPHRLELAAMRRFGVDRLCSQTHRTTYAAGASLPSTLAAADRVVVFNSTVAVEAALVGRPVGLFNPLGIDLGVSFVADGIAVDLRSDESLAAFARGELIHEPVAPSRYVDTSGDAADRIAALVAGLAARR